MDSNNRDHGFMPLNDMLKNLNLIRDKLIEINEKNGSIANFITIRKEIEGMGWGRILAKYHPDINVDDPAAFPLFELYRFVYSTMEKKAE